MSTPPPRVEHTSQNPVEGAAVPGRAVRLGLRLQTASGAWFGRALSPRAAPAAVGESGRHAVAT